MNWDRNRDSWQERHDQARIDQNENKTKYWFDLHLFCRCVVWKCLRRRSIIFRMWKLTMNVHYLPARISVQIVERNFLGRRDFGRLILWINLPKIECRNEWKIVNSSTNKPLTNCRNDSFVRESWPHIEHVEVDEPMVLSMASADYRLSETVSLWRMFEPMFHVAISCKDSTDKNISTFSVNFLSFFFCVTQKTMDFTMEKWNWSFEGRARHTVRWYWCACVRCTALTSTRICRLRAVSMRNFGVNPRKCQCAKLNWTESFHFKCSKFDWYFIYEKSKTFSIYSPSSFLIE